MVDIFLWCPKPFYLADRAISRSATHTSSFRSIICIMQKGSLMIFAGIPFVVVGILLLKLAGGSFGWLPLAFGFCVAVAGGVTVSKTAPQG